MKKALIFLFVSLFQYSLSTEEPTNQFPWREFIKKLDHNSVAEELGYDPGIELIEEDNPNVVHGKQPTIFFHGWGSSKNAPRVLEHIKNSEIIPGDVIVFNFPDATKWAGYIPYFFPIYNSSFAQKLDIITALVVFKALNNVGIFPEVVFSHSRGAGTNINVFGVVNDPSDE